MEASSLDFGLSHVNQWLAKHVLNAVKFDGHAVAKLICRTYSILSHVLDELSWQLLYDFLSQLYWVLRETVEFHELNQVATCFYAIFALNRFYVRI